ncbi:MAG: protein kinase [Thermoprotei archaeon]|nr:MAG: protein kinase [Thermoprotei archaeon]RLF25879.1 MAG: protein kinase [Thermoprotei archaeon]
MSGVGLLPFTDEYKIVRRYDLVPPYSAAVIAEHQETGEIIYFVSEPILTDEELKVYQELMRYLMVEVPKIKEESFQGMVREMYRHVSEIVRKYKFAYLDIPDESWVKILYYLTRDLIGYGPIDPLMHDPMVEDISCDGVNRPVYVWHREYESIPTNIVFLDEASLDEFVARLVHRSGATVSIARPIVDAQMPDGSRLCVTFKREVSLEGSTFTIRKFRKIPFTFADMIRLGTISPEIAAYFWIMLERKRSFLVLGATGSGKTSFLNAVATFIPPNMKIVTVEETPEINLPHKNWVRLIARPAFAGGGSEVTLFDLVKASLRMRPDYLIVGEIRGEEAYVLFQATSTGHGGISTMHAEDFESAVNRLESPPMNIPSVYIPSMNIFAMISRVRVGGRVVRRITEVAEVRSDREFVTIFKWNPKEDGFIAMLNRSFLIPKLADLYGEDVEEILSEIETRAVIARWLAHKGASLDEVCRTVEMYYRRKEKVLEKVRGLAGRDTFP